MCARPTLKRYRLLLAYKCKYDTNVRAHTARARTQKPFCSRCDFEMAQGTKSQKQKAGRRALTFEERHEKTDKTLIFV